MSLKKITTLAAALAALAFAVPASAKEIVTLVHPTDPVFEASVWAIQNGTVNSDKVEFQISFTNIQAVIQSIGTQQYDFVPTVTNIIPVLINRGVPIKLITTNQRYSFKGGGSRVYVAANGPIKSMADMKGKTIGVTSLNSSGVTAARVVMSQLYKVDVALDGGDFKWVEMPLAVLPTALTSGRIDAAVLANQYDYQAYTDKTNYRLLFPEGLKDALGVAVPGTVILGYGPKLQARPEVFEEAVRMLRASADYMMTHQDEVFGAVSKKNSIETDYLKWYFEYYADIPYTLTNDDLKGIKAFWDAVAKLNMIKDQPDLKSLIWDKVRVE